MKTPFFQAGVVAGLLTVTASAWAVPELERGRNEYANQCASCHGSSGQGGLHEAHAEQGGAQAAEEAGGEVDAITVGCCH